MYLVIQLPVNMPAPIIRAGRGTANLQVLPAPILRWRRDWLVFSSSSCKVVGRVTRLFCGLLPLFEILIC